MRYNVVNVLELSTQDLMRGRFCMTRVAIIGSRSLTNVDISKFVPKNTTEIISGGARGIDTLAEKYADKNGIPKIIIKPDYKKYGRYVAPLKRNAVIVKLADVIIALWDGKSRGTKYTIDHAKKCGKPTKIYVSKMQILF